MEFKRANQIKFSATLPFNKTLFQNSHSHFVIFSLEYGERRLSDVFGRLRTSIAKERSFERINKVSGSNARVVLVFVASWQAASAEKDKMKAELDKLGVEMSDVNLMFVTLASAEEFRPFVKNFERDVIKMQSLDYSNAQILADKLSLGNSFKFKLNSIQIHQVLLLQFLHVCCTLLAVKKFKLQKLLTSTTRSLIPTLSSTSVWELNISFPANQ